jgi:toluene monooxygenase system ferredoxin subunit
MARGLRIDLAATVLCGGSAERAVDRDGEVLVARIDDDFVAFPPLCPHMAEPLEVSGICADGTLTCTKHIWQWDLKTGTPMGEAEKPLLHYPIKLDGDALWIDFEGELTYNYDD